LNRDVNFELLPGGAVPEDPTEMVERLSQADIMAKLVARYDVVIFDTPPATVFPDALLLARSCHELVYIVRYRMIPAKIVNHALQRFRETGISILGLVLNRLPETKVVGYGNYHGFGSYRSEYYKTYGEKKKKRSSAA